MNAEEAYERHTDVVRALRDETSDARAAFDAYLGDHRQSHLPGMVQLADPHHLMAMGVAGTETAQVAIGLDWNVSAEPDPELGAVPVGVEDPEADLAAGETRDAVLLPVAAYAEATLDAFAKADTFYVTADMCALLEHAAASLDESDVMPYHPEHPSGFVVLARPLRLPYGDGTEQVVDAFGWAHYLPVRTVFGSVGRAGAVFQFADRVHNPAERGVAATRGWYESKSAWNRSPRLVLSLSDAYVTGAPVGPVVEDVDREEARRRRMEAMKDQEASTPATEGAVVGRFQPYLAAFLLLLSQQVTAPVAATVGAGPARRADRAGRVGRGTERVTVVDLRRRDHHDPAVAGEQGASGRRYQTRHLVGGHWKWQPYGPEHRLRRRIFVEGYVRGPEDKPLVVKPKVFRI